MLKEAQAPRDKMDSCAEALECAVCYDVLGEETVSFTCGHLYYNRKACGSRDVEICPECRAPLVSRTKLFGGVARLKQRLGCKVVTTDVQSVQRKAGTWTIQSFEQINQRRDQEKAERVKEREREQEERRGERERATKHARELQHRLSEVEREREAAKESRESETLESKREEERKRAAHAATSTVLENLKKEMSDLQTAHSELQNSHAVVQLTVQQHNAELEHETNKEAQLSSRCTSSLKIHDDEERARHQVMGKETAMLTHELGKCGDVIGSIDTRLTMHWLMCA